MNRKIFIVSVSVLLCLSIASLAISQERAQGFKPYFERLKTELKLTPEQATKVQKILDEAQKQAEIDRQKYQGDREAMLKAMQQRREKIDREIEAILTKEQKDKYEKIKKERQERQRRLRERRS